MRKFPFFIAFRKVLGVMMKHHPLSYWISFVFVLFLVMIAIARLLIGLDMGMSRMPSVLFL